MKTNRKFSDEVGEFFDDFIESSERMILAEYANKPFIYFNNTPISFSTGQLNENNLLQ